MSGWAAAGSLVTSAMAPYQQHRSAMIQQHGAQDYNTQMYANRYQMTVQDLQKAGLNPMLAYTQGPGSSPTSSIGHGINFDTDAFGKYQQTKLATAQEGQVEALKEKTLSEKSNIDADTMNKVLTGPLLQSQTAFTNTNAEQVRETISKIRAEIQRIDEEIKNININTKKQKSDIDVNKTLSQLNTKKSALTAAETGLTYQNINTNTPKEKASRLNSAYGGAIADNLWKIFSPFGRK